MAKQQVTGGVSELDAFLGDIDKKENADSLSDGDASDDVNDEEEGAEGEALGEEEEEDEFGDDEGSEEDANLDPRDAQIKLLTEQNAQLMQMFKEMKKETEPLVEEPEVDPLEGEQFTALAEAMTWDTEEIGKFKSFFKMYAEHINASVLQGVMAKTPELVTTTLTKQQQKDKIATDFYSAYPELSGVRSYVRTVADEVIKEFGADTPLEEVLRKTAKRAYKALGLKKKKAKATGEKGERQRSPAFPQQKGVRKKPVKKPQELTEIDSLLKGII